MMIADPVGFVESRFGIRLKRVAPQEWAGPCPWCSNGKANSDRFHVWGRGNYACMRPEIPSHCGRSGWLDELDGTRALTKEELLELRVAALERKQKEHEDRLSALEKMHDCGDHHLYHKALNTNEKAVDYWLSEGIDYPTIAKYKLGYCRSCPTAPDHDSYTIPVTMQGKLFNIRHRLVTPNGGGKYRPHMQGLPSMIFNADDLLRPERDILILEGEKKSMVVAQHLPDWPNIATMGMQSFKPEWTAKLRKFQRVYVCYDPDATSKAAEVAGYFKGRGYVVDVPVKADDFFAQYGGSADDFHGYLQRARPVA